MGVLHHASHGKEFLIFRQKLGISRGVWHEEKADKSEEGGDGALN